MMKALVAAACIVVIACGGLLLWRDHQASVARAENGQRMATAYCESIPGRIVARETIPDFEKVVAACLFREDITNDDLNRAIAEVRVSSR